MKSSVENNPGAPEVNDKGELVSMDFDVVGAGEGLGPLMRKTDVITPEEIAKTYSMDRQIPRALISAFGVMDVTEVRSIMNDPAMQEIDSLLAGGEMTLKESAEYAAVLPEHHRLRQRMDDVARRIVEGLVAKKVLRSAIQKSVSSRRKKPGVFGVGWAFGKDVMTKVDLLADTFIYEGGSAFRNSQVYFFKGKLHEYVAQALVREMADRSYVPSDRAEMQGYLWGIDERNASENKPRIHIRMFVDMIDHFENVTREYNKKYYLEMIQSLSAGLSGTDANEESLVRENEQLFGEVGELLEIDKPEVIERKIGQSRLQIAGRRYRKVDTFRLDSSCIIRLIFGPDGKFILPNLTLNEVGNHDVQHFIHNDSVELYMDRYSGALCYCMTNLPISTSLKKRDYLMLKNIVLKTLKDYFNGKKSEPIPGIADATRKEVRAVDASLVTGAASSKSDVSTSGKNTGVLDASGRTGQEEDDGKSFKLFRGMRGLKGNRVLAVIMSLLGRPLRINGSHHIFKGRNGRTYPIPIHGDNQVGLGLLKKCLKMWEIEPGEFWAKV